MIKIGNVKKYFKFIVLLGLLTGHCQAGTIALSLVPARTAGVAPLAVFFDASATTDIGTSTRPFHEIEYSWNFGDPGAGTWANGAQAGAGSKNSATGPLATHIFETPGTYTVTLTAFDGASSTNTTRAITVQDPDTVFAGANTICFSASANFTGCPAGATQVVSSDFDASVNNYMATTRRLLFRRGETFIASTSGNIDANGPGIIGAYGAGAKPMINGPGTTSIIGAAAVATGDWRIMDLQINGQNIINGENVGVGAYGAIHQVTILRLNVTGVHSGIAASHWALSPGDTSFDQWTIQDSTVTGIPNCNWDGHYECNWRIYVAGTRFSVQGNHLDGQGDLAGYPANTYSGGSHVVRVEHWQKSILSNNTIKGAGVFQHNIKLHGWGWGNGCETGPGPCGNAVGGTYTEKILIADNKIVGGINPWLVSMAPQNDVTDERLRDIIFERNWITSAAGTQVGVRTAATLSTFRNNIIDLTGAAWKTGIIIQQEVIEVPDNDAIYNNTIYSGSTGDFNAFDIGATVTNTKARNNLGSAPAATDPVMFVGTGIGLVQSNNLLNNTPSALFVSATPVVPTDFKLKALPNPARNTGFSTIPVFSDFFRLGRPQGGLFDIGAAEGPLPSAAPVAPRNFRLR